MPPRDHGRPADRHAEEGEAVAQERAAAELHGSRVDAEAEPRRRDRLQVRRVGVERPGLVERSGYDLRSLQVEDRHVRQRSAAARPSGVARKCSSGTCRRATRASASDSSPSTIAPVVWMRRPRASSMPGAQQKLGVDRHRTAEAHEHARGHGRERVPGREQPARFVERRRDEPAVHEPRAALVSLVEREVGLVLGQPLGGGRRQPQAGGVVAAAPARRVMVRGDLLHARRSRTSRTGAPGRSGSATRRCGAGTPPGSRRGRRCRRRRTPTGRARGSGSGSSTSRRSSVPM